MTWTSRPPDEEGWYWVNTNPRWNNAPEMVYVGYPEYDDRLHVYGINPLHDIVTLVEYNKEYTRLWMGPVEIPKT